MKYYGIGLANSIGFTAAGSYSAMGIGHILEEKGLVSIEKAIKPAVLYWEPV